MPMKPPTVGARQGRKRAPDTREHAAARGYDYRWQQFRRRYLAANPLCVDCLNPDPLETRDAFEEPIPIVTAATDVHHVKKLKDRPDLKYEDENLMALCGMHHDQRTARGE